MLAQVTVIIGIQKLKAVIWHMNNRFSFVKRLAVLTGYFSGL